MTPDEIRALAISIREIPGVLTAEPWFRVETKHRVYVELKKRNRQRCWDLGAGRRIIVHLPSGRLQWDSGWAGAMTRDWHIANKTWERIEALTQTYLVTLRLDAQCASCAL